MVGEETVARPEQSCRTDAVHSKYTGRSFRELEAEAAAGRVEERRSGSQH